MIKNMVSNSQPVCLLYKTKDFPHLLWNLQGRGREDIPDFVIYLCKSHGNALKSNEGGGFQHVQMPSIRSLSYMALIYKEAHFFLAQ